MFESYCLKLSCVKSFPGNSAAQRLPKCKGLLISELMDIVDVVVVVIFWACTIL